MGQGMITYVGLFLLSAATLIFEITLTRIFSVAQFYHFAFMIVSLALLGFGASGTFLALFPRLKERDPACTLPVLSWGFALSAIGSYALTLVLPFDSFRIALDCLGVAADESVFVGDSYRTDIRGARRAGMPAVHKAGPGDAATTDNARLVRIENLTELPDALVSMTT